MWQRSIVQEYLREDQFVTHNFDFAWKGHSYGVQPDVDHPSASKALTIAGCDIYHPSQDDLTGKEISFCGDMTRSLKKDNYLVIETEAQGFPEWTPYPGQLKLQAFSHLASGADSVMYWHWHSIHNACETYWKGILSHDLATNPTYEEAGVMGREFERLGQDTLCIKKENKVALIVDNRSLDAFKWFPIDKDLSYNDVVRWMYDSLYEMNMECDILDIHALSERNIVKYSMLVTPVLYSIAEEKIALIREFVKAGGVLVSSFKSFVANEELSVYPDAQPHGMTQCFGMHYNQFTEPGKTKFAGEPLSYFAELLQVTTAGSYENYDHKYWGRYAGLTENAYGKGCAFYIGCFTSKEILKKIYRKAYAKAKETVPAFEWPVIVRSGINAKNDTIHYLLHYSEEECEITSPYDHTVDLLSGKEYQKGDTIHLTDWDVCVLKEQ